MRIHPKKFEYNGEIFITSDDVRIEEVTYCKSDVSSPDSVPGDPTVDRINVVVKVFIEESSANEFRLFYNEFKHIKSDLVVTKKLESKNSDQYTQKPPKIGYKTIISQIIRSWIK